MKISVTQVLPLGVNCIIIKVENGDTAIIDPGGSFDSICYSLDVMKATPKMILCTHGHFDHVGAIEELKDKYKIPVYIHGSDKTLMENAKEMARYFGALIERSPKADQLLNGGEKLQLGEIKIDVIHTPGHSGGCVCYYIENEKLLITGDTLFKGSIGRTDFEGSNHADIADSIVNKLYKLPDDVKVYPGHGEYTTIGYEKKNNAFFRV